MKMGYCKKGKFGALGLAILSIFVGFPVSAAEILSLKQALRLAQRRHVEVLVADQRVQAAVARIGQAKSVLLPNFEATTSQYRRTVNLETFGINIQNIPGFNLDPKPPPFNVFDARIALRQTLFDLSALRQFKSAKIGSRLSQEDRRRAEADALALTATLYLEAQSAQRTLENARALVRREEARYKLAGAEREIGLGSDLAVTQSRAALVGIRNQVAGAEREATERRLDLAAALGLPPEQEIRFSNSASIWKLKTPDAPEIQRQLDQHPDIAVARRQVELNLQERRVEKADYYPKIVGAADYGASGPDPGNATDTYNYGAGLSIPIYQGGLRKARIREASANVRESELRLEQMRRDREAAVLSALAALKQTAESRRAAEADLTQSRATLGVSEARSQTGLGSQLEVVESRREVIAAQERLDQANASYRLAWVNLEHRLGRMQAWLEEMPDS
jgi:outer membrane protein